MRFGRPDLLWLFLAAVPVIVLYLVRRRRRKLRVPSLVLWERVLAREPQRFGAGVPSALLSLLLVLLALGAVVLAAADPESGAAAPGPRPLLLCVSSSARMGEERWTRAIALVEEEIRRKAADDPVTLLLVSAEPRILAAGETDPARVLANLRRFSPDLVGAGWGLARPVVADALASRARVAAVGVAPEVATGVSVLPTGGENSGITAFDSTVRDEDVLVFLRTSGAEGGQVVVTLDGAEVSRREAKPVLDFAVPRGAGGVLRVSLEPGSGPEFDDSVRARISPRPTLRIGVVAEDGPSPFLEAALAVAGPIVDLDGSSRVASSAVTRAAGDFDVMILKTEKPPERLAPGRWVLISPPVEALGLEPLDPNPVSPVWRSAEGHPVTRGVDAAEVQIVGASPARLPPDAEPLLSSPLGAVAAAGERDGVRYVWIGLSERNSTLPVTGAFPLLLRNALRWFAALDSAPLRPAYRLGEAIAPAVRLPAGLVAVGISGPGDRDREVRPVEGGRFSYRPRSRVEGEVIVRIGSSEHSTFVNALLPEESAAAGVEGAPEFGPDRSGLRDTRVRLWPWLVAGAALLLLLEWLHHRLTRA